MSGPVADAYRRHGQAVFRYLVRMSGDATLAEDVLHDTFERLMSRPPAHRADLRAWLFRVATNRLRDVQRKRQRRLLALRRIDPRTSHSEPPGPPDRAVESTEATARARALLANLSERDRTILLMREEGFTHREIAEAVGTTTGSVGTMIARALDRVAAVGRTTTRIS